MKIKKILWLTVILGVGWGGEVSASECGDSLRNASIPIKNFVGLSVYRLFNKYPPNAKAERELSWALSEYREVVLALNISSDCVRGKIFTSSMKQTKNGLIKTSSDDVIPVRVFSGRGVYILFFLYPGYVEEEGTGDELAAGLAIYNMDGVLVSVGERVASWASNEGTLLLRESCFSQSDITTVEVQIFPREIGEGGVVVDYMVPEYISRSSRGILNGEGYSGSLDCTDDSYVGVLKSTR